MQKKGWIWTLIFIIALIGFTAYVAADTFLISRVYTVVSSESSQTIFSATETTILSTAETESETQSVETEMTVTEEVTENSYVDSNICIVITEYREYDTSIYVADITLSDAAYLRTAFAKNAYGKNVTEKTSEIAENVNAILAINGDYYGVQENGYVLRNGIIYRDSTTDREDLVIDTDGSFSIISELDITAAALLEDGAAQVLSFGPALVTEYQIAVTEDEEVGKAMASNPRTAIGIVDDLHYLFVVSDGRTSESEGLTLYELAEFMQKLDCKIAYNLDGGGSSTMVFNGTVINNPTTNGKRIKEREVSDIVYIGY